MLRSSELPQSVCGPGHTMGLVGVDVQISEVISSTLNRVELSIRPIDVHATYAVQRTVLVGFTPTRSLNQNVAGFPKAGFRFTNGSYGTVVSRSYRTAVRSRRVVRYFNLSTASIRSAYVKYLLHLTQLVLLSHPFASPSHAPSALAPPLGGACDLSVGPPASRSRHGSRPLRLSISQHRLHQRGCIDLWPLAVPRVRREGLPKLVG